MEPGFPKIASLDDIQSITENLEKYAIPKLDEAAVFMLNNVIGLFERNNQGSNILVGVQLVISIISQSIQSFTYNEDDWNLVASSITKLVCRILNLITFNPIFLNSEQSDCVLCTTAEIFQTLGNTTSVMKSLLMEQNGVQVLQLICWEEVNFAVRKKLLFSLKKLLSKLTTGERISVVNKIAFLKSSLVKLLLSCGDLEFQEYLTEVLVRFALSLRGWKNVLKSWFSYFPLVVEAVEVLDTKIYEASSRLFLNVVNDSQSPESKIHSLPCLYAAISGHRELKKPNGYNELWIDCSPRSGDIQLLVDGGANTWARVTVEYAGVQSIKCSRGAWSGEEEACQLVISVHPSIVVPFESALSFSELVVLLKKDQRFLEMENHFLKQIYAHYYEPERARAKKAVIRAPEKLRSPINTIITSSSSRKTSLADATLSTIERATSTFRSGSDNSVDKCGRFSTFVIPNRVKQISASTPLKRKESGPTRVQGRCKILRNSVGIEPAEDRIEREGNIDVVIRSGQRTSVSDQVTHLARREDGEADRVKSQQIASDSQCTHIHDVENAMSNSRKSNEESLMKLMEEVTHEIKSPSNGHILPGGLEVLSTNDKITTMKNSEKSQITGPQTLLSPGSPMVGDGPCDVIANNVVEVVDLTTPTSGSVGHSVLHGSSVVDSNELSVSATSAGQRVLGGNHSLVDFKALQPPAPLVRPTLPEKSPSTLPFKKKFFGKFRVPRVEITESEASFSSCSTKISKKHFSGIVQIRSPALNLDPLGKPNANTPTCDNPHDPFSFVEDEEIRNCNRVVEGTKDKFSTPTTKERKRRKLYTPGRDDVLHSDRESHTSDPQNHKAPAPCYRSLKGRKKKCVLDQSSEEPKRKRKKHQNQIVDKNNANKRILRQKKKVCYKDASSGESGVCFAKPRVADMVCRVPLSRMVEPLRSERVALSPPMPQGSAPSTVVVDYPPLSPPRVPVTASDSVPIQISPPPQIEMVDLSSPVKPFKIKQRAKRKKVNADLIEDKPEEKIHACTESGLPTCSIPSSSTPTIQPVLLDSDPSHSKKGDELLNFETSIPGQTKQFGFGDSQIQFQDRIDAISNRIWSEVRTYVNGVKSESSPMLDSIKVNLRTCLATHEAVMNTILQESLNVARSAANVQSACEKGLASFEVVVEMMKVIEEIHRESAVAAAVRNNDPRTYSHLRQQIYKLIEETLSHKE